MTSEKVLTLAYTVNRLIEELCPDKNSFEVYGVTNYMDMRVAITLKYLMDNSITMSPDHKKDLANALEDFLDYVATNDGRYFLSGSGTYTLKFPDSVLRQVLHELRV
jgi:cupin superfamily acireductone dioxygenase involved in methionine salvage